MLCPRGCGTELDEELSNPEHGWLHTADGSLHTPERCADMLAAKLRDCERLREHARIVSDAAAAGVLTLGHILPLRACLPEFSAPPSAPPPAKEDGK